METETVSEVSGPYDMEAIEPKRYNTCAKERFRVDGL